MKNSVPLTIHDPPRTKKSPNTQSLEITRLADEYQKTGNERLKNRLAQAMDPFVMKTAKKIVSEVIDGSIDTEDLYCAGWLGFLKALKSFDPSRGYQFLTYAGIRIRGEMLDLRRKQCPAFRRRKKKENNVYDPNYQAPLSLDEALVTHDGGYEESSITLIDIVASVPCHLDTIVAQDDEDDVWKITIWLLDRLQPQERYVLIHYFLLKKKLWQIAEELGCSESNACLIKKKALNNIKSHLEQAQGREPLRVQRISRKGKSMVSKKPKKQKRKKGIQKRSVVFGTATLEGVEPYWMKDGELNEHEQECYAAFDMHPLISFFAKGIREFQLGYDWLVSYGFICSIGDLIYKIHFGRIQNEIDAHRPAFRAFEKTVGSKAILRVLMLPIWDEIGNRFILNIGKSYAFLKSLRAPEPIS